MYISLLRKVFEIKFDFWKGRESAYFYELYAIDQNSKREIMNAHADQTQDKKSKSASNAVSQMQAVGESTFKFADNRPEAIAQMKLQELAENSPQVSQLRAFQDRANNSPQFSKTAQLQAMADNYSAQQQQPIQKKKTTRDYRIT
jgi:hypothetical protein